ncbi:IQ and ubiquitin-like domain protein (macronuclear) [Tetrahymena thermophila SB210]|uniref:IQ and ubiquitin-like domain protein n=1 Tax=Tetrahymena thermophila (strain SB210) TaxID=312017 RepID=I7M989_TETTS|nr:IQ and ubiquitin-like domain protein [Tetrahymena thermophila SB210]EAS01129.2 IQ and ubiquitin-like domain protein [Tetrahymena thermophila SB210]|eukprot:XP_001021374.2 IQ and ubiquitin-like domain protein [Tetrahymena thermophila SB210]
MEGEDLTVKHIPDNAEVRIVKSNVIQRDEKGEIIKQYEMNIEVYLPIRQKPYLGGYKSNKNGLVYHHAFAQTDQKYREHKLKFHRESQTYEYSTKSSKVMRELGTQMEREGIFISKLTDVEVEAQPYFHSNMWEERREEAALYIQRKVRGWRARRITEKLKKQKEEKRREQLEKEEEYRRNEEAKHKREIERRTHPRTKEDFNILYDELELWRTNEIQKIKENTSLSEQERKTLLKQILDKETDLLQTIDRLKIIASKENKEEKINKFLKQMSDPKKWLRSDGRYTEVHTPFTVRSKELMDIYNGLRLKNLTIDERLDILLNTKWTVKEWDCNLTREIVELIDREADMLNRGRPEASLEGLRQRLCNLFLQFIETPEFNPEAARFQKIPYEILVSTQAYTNSKR